MAVNPVILFLPSAGPTFATGNHMTDSGTALVFSIPQVCISGTTALAIQCWPTTGGTAINLSSGSFSFNGGAPSPLTLTAIGGGGASGSIVLGGNAKDVNTLAVTVSDNGGNATTAQVLYYLRATFMITEPYQQTRAKKKTPAKKKAGGKKK